mmetsp:Transcript_4817/g.19308  ORF Transcript_4817/g.19308 Transcript_4817/m.19308 type:complete len:339 (+) Transcript_4817:1501-2517(+)
MAQASTRARRAASLVSPTHCMTSFWAWLSSVDENSFIIPSNSSSPPLRMTICMRETRSSVGTAFALASSDASWSRRTENLRLASAISASSEAQYLPASPKSVPRRVFVRCASDSFASQPISAIAGATMLATKLSHLSPHAPPIWLIKAPLSKANAELIESHTVESRSLLNARRMATSRSGARRRAFVSATQSARNPARSPAGTSPASIAAQSMKTRSSSYCTRRGTCWPQLSLKNPKSAGSSMVCSVSRISSGVPSVHPAFVPKRRGTTHLFCSSSVGMLPSLRNQRWLTWAFPSSSLTVRRGNPICIVQLDMISAMGSPDSFAQAFQRSVVTAFSYL